MTPRSSSVCDPTEDVVVIIMGGGRGSRLYPLTRDRAKPAVCFGGKYRLIDIPLTNCLHSKLDKIYILTQFNSFSLNRHIWQTYSRELTRQGMIDVIAAEQTPGNRNWFQGTADAVRQSLHHVLTHKPKYVLILSGDQIYSMDYRDMLGWHLNANADVTIAAKYSAPEELHGLGVVNVDDEMGVAGFYEKPETPDLVADFSLERKENLSFPDGKPFLASMGIYIFNTDVLVDALSSDEEDFGKSIIPQCAQTRSMACFPFDGYWRDVGTVHAFYEANMEWRMGRGIVEMFADGDVMITHARHLCPTRIHGTVVNDSIIAEGSNIAAKAIDRSIVGVRARIGANTEISDSVIFGNAEQAANDTFEIGRDCVIRNAILDKNAVIGDGCKLINAEGVENIDTDNYSISNGVIVVPRDGVIPPGTVI